MKLLDFIFAARPMLHLPGWSIYLVALHYHHQISGGQFGWRDLAVVCGITCLTAGAMYLNQVFDRESDKLNRKLGFLSRGLMTEHQMMAAFLLCSLVGIAMGIMVSLVTTAIFLQAFALAWLYSSPPFRMKDRPFWGLFANGYAFGFLIAFAVMPKMTEHNLGLLGWDNPSYFWAVVSAVYCLTTVPDAKGDAATGKRTMAVVFGRPLTILVAALLFAIGLWLAWQSGFVWLAALAGLPLLLALANLVWKSDRFLLATAKLPILLLSLLAGYFYPAYLVFMIVLIWATRLYYKHRWNLTYPSIA